MTENPLRQPLWLPNKKTQKYIMKIKLLMSLAAMFFFASCFFSGSDKGVSVEEIIEKESQVIETSGDILSGSFSRKSEDLIAKLYKEALEKDADLKLLDSEMREIGEMVEDSLADYRKYVQTNFNYWSLVDSRINTLEDSVSRTATRAIFNRLYKNYLTGLTNYENNQTVIKEQKRIIKDQLVLMELFVTEKMMRTYQTDQKPSIETFKAVIKKSNELIEKSRKYTK